MRHVEDAADRLEKARDGEKSILVSYSGGKDSLAVMDLAVRVFGAPNIKAFMMEAIPGLRYTAEMSSDLQRRHGIALTLLPHWSMLQAIGSGCYCDATVGGGKKPSELASMKNAKLADIHAMARSRSGITTIATGYKRADSLWRRRMMSIPSAMVDLCCPLANWTQKQVVEYLNSRKIPIPEDMGGSKFLKNGVGLDTRSVCWMHDNLPDDFAKLEVVFPYVGAIIARRRFYGIKE
jgi:3'-phosphoadenosine 5'-phosphosulfate sulfotransferase (PAPS reductase)/FAD synthetase